MNPTSQCGFFSHLRIPLSGCDQSQIFWELRLQFPVETSEMRTVKQAVDWQRCLLSLLLMLVITPCTLVAQPKPIPEFAPIVALLQRNQAVTVGSAASDDQPAPGLLHFQLFDAGGTVRN